MKKKMYLLVCCLAFSLVGCGGKSPSPPPEQGIESTIPGHEHSYSMQYQSNPTCKEEGKRVDKCSCGQTRTTILEKTAHNYKEKLIKKATCQEPGLKAQKCTVCDHEITEPIPQLEHNWKTLRKTASSCSEEGIESRECDRCHEKEDKVLPLKEHTFREEIIEATCTTKGKEMKVCWFCEKTELVKELPLKQHDYELFERVPSSCTKDGLLEKICRHCKKTESSVLPKVEHTFVEQKLAATCTEDGYERLACEGCGLIMNETIFIAPGHTPTTKTIKKPTCTESGLIENICSTCGAIQKQETEPTGHKCSTYDKEPTCTEIGYHSRKCDVCGYVESYTEKAALGHKQIELRRVEPTCVKDGYIEKVCSVCLVVIKEPISKIPHKYELVEEDAEWRHYECAHCQSTKKERK